MSDSLNSNVPEPKRVGVWAEQTRIEPKDFVIPKKSPESGDDIPTIPDLDDLQDILEKEISVPPVREQKNTETANALAEVVSGYSGSVDGIEAAIEVLKSYIPHVEEEPDAVWSVDSLLTELAGESDVGSTSGISSPSSQ